MSTRTTIAVASGTTLAVAVATWFALGTPGLGGDRPQVSVLAQATETPAPSPSPSPTPTPSPKPSPSPSPTTAVSATRSPTPRPTLSPTPTPEVIDVGEGAYASVLLKNGYGFCPCDAMTFRAAAPSPSLSLSCLSPGTLPARRLVTITLKVSNSSSKPVSFTELAGPRWVYLSLASDPGRAKDMNGGFADNAGHKAGGKGWWNDTGPDSGAYQKAAGTVRHTVPAHGSLKIKVLGSTVRAKDGVALVAGPYYLEAGFLTAPAHAWTCAQRNATIA